MGCLNKGKVRVMRYLFNLILIISLGFGFYLRKKKIVIFPRWFEISAAVAAVAYIVFIWAYVFLM